MTHVGAEYECMEIHHMYMYGIHDNRTLVAATQYILMAIVMTRVQ